MFLKKLEMLGFKSFADRTDFAFRPGMTAIVGPNGCGKSNVVDAFKWIFGSQSAKGLRGSEMKDVIFNGTQSRKPAGYAEVTCVFDNADRFLDLDYSEVAISRRLYRSGESEYLINKQKCRLKDIRELFLDTGIGQTSYSMLEQGKIDILLQSSPQDRRLIFEEAAGISKYRVKKAESLRALLRVEDNLARLQDILDEVEKRIRRVKTQAAKARRYKRHSERLKELRVRLALEDYRGSVDGRVELSFRLWHANWRIAREEALEARLAAGLEAQQEEHRELVERLEGARDEAYQATGARERVEQRIETYRRRLEELEQERDRKREDLEATVERIGALRSEVASEREEHRALRQAIEGLGERVAELTTALEEKQRDLRERQESLRERKESAVAAIQRRSQVGNLLAQVESELKNLRGRKERLETALDAFRQDLERARGREAELRRTAEDLETRRDALDRERAELDERARGMEAEIGAVEERLAGRREELHRKSSRLDVLRSFEESLDGVASGVAEVLRRSEELPPVARPCGMIASLLAVERRHAKAVEGALGETAQALVVGSHEGALELLGFAQREGLGGVQCVALDRVDYVERESFPRQGGVLGCLRDAVRCDPEHEELVDRLLANVVLVEDLPTAVALARNGLRPFRLVTLAGEVVEPWGGFAVAGPADTGLISRKSEMEELTEELSGLEAEVGELESDLAARRERVAECRAECERKECEHAELDRRALAARGEQSQASREAERLEREISVSSSELEEVERDIAGRDEEKSAREEEARTIESEQQELDAGIREVEGSIGEAEEAVRSAGDDLAQARLEQAQTRKQEEGLRQLIAEREGNLEERERHAEAVRQETDHLEQRRAETESALASASEELETARGRESELGERKRELEAEDERRREIERAFRAEMDRVRARAAEARREREELQLRDQEERHRRDTVLERIDEQYGLDLRELTVRAGQRGEATEDGAGLAWPQQAADESAGEAPSETVPAQEAAAPAAADASDEPSGEESSETVPAQDAPDAPADGLEAPGDETDGAGPLSEERLLQPFADEEEREAARREIRELQEKLRRLGSVNLEALDEIEELEERWKFQKKQRDDLQESERHLRGIIQDINRKSRELFTETFADVQKHFGELFRKSFGGGRAELVLEEGADILEAGIEIVARPPGKKLTSLSLMSGGEKTMTTIALLLAIFRARPSPFCILDEVDAPLDDANVRRFIVLLKDFVEQSQFIIITHNKLTMAEAGTLYGVTMQERGVSRRVAVELESYDPESLELAASGSSGEE